jgi:uncharacterized membrane protein YkoI
MIGLRPVMFSRRALLAFAVLAVVAADSGARADDGPTRARPSGSVHHDDIARAVAQGRALPLAQVLAKLGDRLPGRIVRVEMEDEDGRLVYEFKVVDPLGRRREFYVDALTADILEEDD